jgi:hypothetical protein
MLRVRALEREFDECVAEVPAAQVLGYFRMDQLKRLGRSLVDEKRRVTLFSQFETARRDVIHYGLSESVIYMAPSNGDIYMRSDYGRWFLVPALLIIVVAGCTSSPTAPLPPTMGSNLSPPTVTPSIAGMVIDPNDGVCIRGATVESIAGQAVGQKVVQEGSCDYWSHDVGFTFKELTPGILMTLRASAPGFATKDLSGVGPGQWDIVIKLERLSAQ